MWQLHAAPSSSGGAKNKSQCEETFEKDWTSRLAAKPVTQATDRTRVLEPRGVSMSFMAPEANMGSLRCLDPEGRLVPSKSVGPAADFATRRAGPAGPATGLSFLCRRSAADLLLPPIEPFFGGDLLLGGELLFAFAGPGG
mmetsp:Transcript_55727/g.90155  ORF Transcript_55727/g.90155 Transcript_55727/m.90155 type:complete len:141 (-) Transcript_55727:1005-1427(-)